MLTEHMESMPTNPDALLFISPGGGGARKTGDGGPIRHSLFVRRVFKPAIVGDENNKDESKRCKPALPAEKHNLRWHYDRGRVCTRVLPMCIHSTPGRNHVAHGGCGPPSLMPGRAATGGSLDALRPQPVGPRA